MAAPGSRGNPAPAWVRFKGTVGSVAYVYANAYKIRWDDSRPGQGHIYEYDAMAVIPKHDATEKERNIGKPKARDLMQRLQVEVHPQVFQGQGAYDSKNILWSTRQLPLPGGVAGEFELPFTRPDRQHPIPNPTMVKIKITFAKQVERRVLTSFVSGQGLSDLRTGEPFEPEEAATALNALNVIFQHAPTIAGAVRNGRRLFVASAGQARQNGPFSMVQGYFQSVRPIPLGLMVNVDVVTGLLIRENSADLMAFCQEFLEASGKLMNLSGQDFQKLRYALRGLQIQTTMSGPGSRVRKYKIQDLVKRAGRVVFDKGASKITVAEHFRQVYNITIKYPDMIGVRVGRKEHPIILPLEVCRLVTPQLFTKQPPPRIQSAIVQHAAKDPRERMAAIQRAREELAYDSSVSLAGAGLAVAPNLAQVKGRLLQPPQLQFGNQTTMTFGPRDAVGQWNVTRHQFADAKSINVWCVIDMATMRDNDLYDFVNELMNVMKDRGMRVAGQPARYRLTAPDSEGIKRTLLQLPGKPDLIIFVLPPNSPDLYRLCKRTGDINMAVVTQCVTAGKRFNNQYCNNLALKINVKLGGVNSYVRGNIMDGLKGQEVMALGADVSHPMDVSQPSVAALVSSVDDYCMKYVASIRIQPPRQEVISDMEEMVTHALRCYFLAHGNKLPKILLFYRDGVSEGEYRTLAITEVSAIKAAFKKAYGDNMSRWPGLIFVIVGKRHHIRFFPGNESVADRTNNCKSGLVVDDDISHPTEFNYYLQSQPGLKGTSRPSHYVAIINSMNMPADILQQLSYGLCFAYARSSRAVSIPAPVYYADLVCRRAKFHFDDQVSVDADYSSDSSGSFNLEFWKDHFTSINPAMSTSMYFV